ncbi:NAD(P)-dependent oxidoreductase [Mycobacterium ahvazicum]|uniref:NAD(P)-dependent oxidoreductase n=1 Tax=Mycobacterium ahvazicum TaxID=1964395 RepID=A0A2K4YH55_9MYCO|nr:NAD(P)-dependent oxidoreductase [Mycobacterium ahvazicum]
MCAPPFPPTIRYPAATSDELVETARAVKNSGCKALVREIDIRNLADQQQLIADAIDQFGRLDVVVAWLAGDGSANISGSQVVVDRGHLKH